MLDSLNDAEKESLNKVLISLKALSDAVYPKLTFRLLLDFFTQVLDETLKSFLKRQKPTKIQE